MRAENVVSKELLSYLVMLEPEHQGKVVTYIKRLLGKEGMLDETNEMNKRAELSEQDISAGRVKNASTFKLEFEQWQKKKQSTIKL